jgi:hypothetical protein
MTNLLVWIVAFMILMLMSWLAFLGVRAYVYGYDPNRPVTYHLRRLHRLLQENQELMCYVYNTDAWGEFIRNSQVAQEMVRSYMVLRTASDAMLRKTKQTLQNSKGGGGLLHAMTCGNDSSTVLLTDTFLQRFYDYYEQNQSQIRQMMGMD